MVAGPSARPTVLGVVSVTVLRYIMCMYFLVFTITCKRRKHLVYHTSPC